MQTVSDRVLSLTRLWSKVDASGDCWLWTGSPAARYGAFWTGTRTVKAHRIVYETLVGPIPTDKEPDHLCRTKRCVNPDHIEIVTRKVNMRRGFSPSGLHSRKTHCNSGHPFTAANTYVYSSGKRQGRRKCRVCDRERRNRPTLAS